MNEDDPLNSCHNKAMFLLKFAGLTRVSYDSNRPSSPVTSRPSWGQKSWRLQKSQSVVSTVGRIKQQVSDGCGLNRSHDYVHVVRMYLLYCLIIRYHARPSLCHQQRNIHHLKLFLVLSVILD